MQRAPDRLLLLEIFLRTLERGSVSRAAEDLGMSQGRASKLLRSLEDQLGTTLLRRDTHCLAPTEAGEEFADGARALVESWNGLLDEHAEERGGRARLSVVASSDLGPESLFALVAGHASRRSIARLRWSHDDSEISFRRSGCDLWVRVGTVQDSGLVVTTVGQVDSVIVAAPEVAANAALGRPADLKALEAVGSTRATDNAWHLTSDAGEVHVVTLAFRVVADTTNDVRIATRRGFGVAALPLPWVTDDLEAGELVRVLPGWVVERRPVNLVHAPSRYASPLLKSLVESLRHDIPRIAGVDAA